VNQGLSPGTWTSNSYLGPGDSYQVSVYAPEPSPSELGSARADYSGLPQGYLAIELPLSSGAPSPSNNILPAETFTGDQRVVAFAPFHSGGPIQALVGPPHVSGAALLRAADAAGGSSYSQAYGLAKRLAAGAATPYQFALAVERHLADGYTYTESPPRVSYPLTSFLFTTRRGYCQQFAGAMALLLRMGGVPARVAVGFTSGHRDAATGRWLVTDYDAHAWVEVWFPHYGWVRFDPTPAASDPALNGHRPSLLDSTTNLAATGAGLSASKTSHGRLVRKRSASSPGHSAAHAAHGGSDELPWVVALPVVALLALVLVATKPLRSAEALVAELDVALRRIGRPLPAGATLTWLERRVGGSPEAAAYVRGLQLARFGRAGRLPTTGQRRALRRQLRLGMGALGMLRSVWALPPRWGRSPTRADRQQDA
jgi:hypothetical protein